MSEEPTDIIATLRELQGKPRYLTHHEIQEIIDEVESLRSMLDGVVVYLDGGAYRRNHPLQQQMMARAFLKTGLKRIVLELRTLAENKAPVAWRKQDAANLRKAADELERLRKVLSGQDDLLEEAVAGERAAILAEVEKLANGADWLAVIDLAAALKARGNPAK
jgi:hypothetical protein